MNEKTLGIVAYLTLIGWIIALVLNQNTKSEAVSFHLRQMLLLIILSFVLGIIPFVNLIAFLVLFILWIVALVGAIQGRQTNAVPILGPMAQGWFKFL